jgi:hypothetical protein
MPETNEAAPAADDAANGTEAETKKKSAGQVRQLRARAGRKGGTPADPSWHARFVQCLRDTANVSGACRLTRIKRATAYVHREQFKDFRAAWDSAIEDAVDAMEAEAQRRAVKGTQRPVYQGGKKVGLIREYSDSLLMFLLKGRRRAVFGEQVEHSGPGGGAIRYTIVPAVPPAVRT